MNRIPYRGLMLLVAAVFIGCGGHPGPTRTLLYKATPLPGANSQVIDLKAVEAIIHKRLKAVGWRGKIIVQPVAPDSFEVTVRGADQATLDKINVYITAWGRLEFAEVAHPKFNAAMIELAKDAEREVTVDGEVQAEWLPVAQSSDGSPKPEFASDDTVVWRDHDENGKSSRQWLVIYEPGHRITGDMLAKANVGSDDTGRPTIMFELNPEGTGNMQGLTSSLKPMGSASRKLAIIINGLIHSAPTVRGTIGSKGQISGEFTKQEVEETVSILRSGEMPCQLTLVKLVSEEPESR